MDVGVVEIRQWHLARGWLDVGYHYIIRRDGTLESGRPPTRAGAHARGFNQESLGICMVGGVTEADKTTAEDNFTDAQYAELKVLVERLKTDYPQAEVLGHRDLPYANRECPSFCVRSWYANITD